MNEKAKTILIGIFIIIACLAIIGMLLFLRPSVGDGKKKLFVCFTSIEKVQIGTRVTFAGKPVGEVIAIDEIYDARSQPTDRGGHVCFYELELALDSHTVVYDTDEITIHTTGLLGERTIAIIPKAVKKGQPSYPVTNQIMYGKSGDVVEETLNQIVAIGTKASDTLDLIKEVIDENKGELPPTLSAIREAAEQVKLSFESVNSTSTIEIVNDTFTKLASMARKTDRILTDWESRDLGSTVPEIAKNLSAITTAINKPEELANIIASFSQIGTDLKGFTPSIGNHGPEIIENLRCSAGNFKTFCHNLSSFSSCFSQCGSIGKLFKSDEFYLRLTSLMSKANVLMDDVNNYGVLFHLDKCWQRERLKRINILNTLRRPEDFRCYFEGEVSQIGKSISRIAMTLKKAEQCHERACVVNDREFKCGYSDLLKRLSSLEDMLHTYQEQLIEINRCCCN